MADEMTKGFEKALTDFIPFDYEVGEDGVAGVVTLASQVSTYRSRAAYWEAVAVERQKILDRQDEEIKFLRGLVASDRYAPDECDDHEAIESDSI